LLFNTWSNFGILSDR